jgi:hypothetical protein
VIRVPCVYWICTFCECTSTRCEFLLCYADQNKAVSYFFFIHNSSVHDRNRTTSEPRSYQLFWSRASPHPSSKRFARNGAATADSFVGSDYLHDLFAPHILFMYLSTKISSTNCSNVRLPLLSCRNQFLEKKRRKKKKSDQICRG